MQAQGAALHAPRPVRKLLLQRAHLHRYAQENPAGHTQCMPRSPGRESPTSLPPLAQPPPLHTTRLPPPPPRSIQAPAAMSWTGCRPGPTTEDIAAMLNPAVLPPMLNPALRPSPAAQALQRPCSSSSSPPSTSWVTIPHNPPKKTAYSPSNAGAHCPKHASTVRSSLRASPGPPHASAPPCHPLQP